jgi:Tfp pilus assembly protein PilV
MGVMRRTPRHPRTPRYAAASAEDGFALIEVIASAVLFLVLATATLAVIDRSGSVSNANRSRSIATGLAQADQDSMRQSPPVLLTNLHKTAFKTIAGITYTIKSDAEWFRDATGVVGCNNSTARAEYVQITSQVTWPTMGSLKPVTMESYVTPGLTSLTRGALTVTLARSDGTGTAGILVTATPAGGAPVSGVTDANGCVVLGNLAPGSAVTEWNTSGYVNKDGVSDVVGSTNIATGLTSNVNDSYDNPGKAVIGFVDSNGKATAWPNVTALQTGMTGGLRSYPAPVAGRGTGGVTFDGLYPFTTNYSFYAGGCAGADPSKYQQSYGYATGKVPRAGTLSGMTAKLPVQRFDISGTTASSQVFLALKPDTTATPAMTGCDTLRFQLDNSGTSTSEYITDPTNPTKQVWTVPLPYGQWKVCLDNGNATGKWQKLTNTIKNTGPAATLATGAPAPTTSTYAVPSLTGGTSGANPYPTTSGTGLCP